MTRTFFILLMLLPVILFADDPLGENQGTISDDDKTSTRISDMITTVEQARKAIGVAEGAKEAVDLAKNLKKFNLKERAVKEVKGALIQYKNTKQSFIQFISGVTDQVTLVLDKASSRVNMWRTTEPTLLAFGDGLKQMANNSVKVFQEFEPKDLIDIDRKWDRKVEDQLLADKRFVLGCIYFLDFKSSIKARESFNALFLDDGLKDHMTKTPLGTKAMVRQMIQGVHTYHKIPSIAMNHASESIEAVGRISGKSHESSQADPSMSVEQQDMNKIYETLSDEEQTYEDARELASLISLKRQTVATQTTQLQQIYSTLQADLARMYLNDQEIIAQQAEQMSSSLKIISGGAPLQTIEEKLNERTDK